VPDLLEVYGIDLASGIAHTRSGRWLRTLILGLLATPASRLHRQVTADSKKEDGG
jgi:hypothetical protein